MFERMGFGAYSQNASENDQKDILMSIDGSMNTHMLYFDGFHRDHGAIALSRQALTVFCDTILFGRRNELLREDQVLREWEAAGNTLATSLCPPSPWGLAPIHPS